MGGDKQIRIDNMSPRPRTFLSYSHEETEHDEWVKDLASKLIKNGVDAQLDKWELIPGQDLTFFMESQIRDSDFVILICTPQYCKKSNIPRGGVGYEKNIISAEMLQASDLKPKFIPILRKGTHDNALPTYLGSKYAIDFRDSRDQIEALKELLRAIYKQPHPEKPPLGPNPFESLSPISSTEIIATPKSPSVIYQEQDIDVWEKEASGRFTYLCEKKLNKENPFINGFWQASFVLLLKPQITSLKDFLEKLKASETGRTGWDIAWVPNRLEIAPYPFKNGIEVWLAENGDKGPAFSDFWRAEPIGRFSLFRGYQEDDQDFLKRYNISEKTIDFSLFLWRISELCLYLQNFSKQMQVENSKAIIKVTWHGLENRKISYHKGFKQMYNQYICQQDIISSTYEIKSCSNIKKNLIHDVHEITRPLFESFNFFSVTEANIKDHIKDLFDPNKEGV